MGSGSGRTVPLSVKLVGVAVVMVSVVMVAVVVVMAMGGRAGQGLDSLGLVRRQVKGGFLYGMAFSCRHKLSAIIASPAHRRREVLPGLPQDTAQHGMQNTLRVKKVTKTQRHN